MDFELIAEGLKFPEGPIAMADGSVILTEIHRKTLSRVTPDGAIEILCETGGGPNGAAIGPDGAIYIANNGGSFDWVEKDGRLYPGDTSAGHKGGSIQRFDLKTGELTTLYAECDGARLIGPNDLVFDRQGGFWFTDHGCGTPDGVRFGGLYYAKADGSQISRQRAGLLSPNGVGLSPDERVVYMADTKLARLWAFDVAEPGRLAPAKRGPGRVICNLQGHVFLDSLAVEAGGKVCVATILNGGITVFDPDGSIEHHPTPESMPTNICFGGADMREGWVTASSTGKLYKTRWPRPGLTLNFSA